MESFPQYTQAILDRINTVIDGKPEAEIGRAHV